MLGPIYAFLDARAEGRLTSSESSTCVMPHKAKRGASQWTHDISFTLILSETEAAISSAFVTEGRDCFCCFLHFTGLDGSKR